MPRVTAVEQPRLALPGGHLLPVELLLLWPLAMVLGGHVCHPGVEL